MKSIRTDLENLREWKQEIELHVSDTERRLADAEARLVRLEAQKNLRLAGGLDDRDADGEQTNEEA